MKQDPDIVPFEKWLLTLDIDEIVDIIDRTGDLDVNDLDVNELLMAQTDRRFVHLLTSNRDVKSPLHHRYCETLHSEKDAYALVFHRGSI